MLGAAWIAVLSKRAVLLEGAGEGYGAAGTIGG
jgi:hypothetical protein